MTDPSQLESHYNQKQNRYFSAIRSDIVQILPAASEKVLEVGCGSGATLNYLKEQGLSKWCAGIELSAGPALEAKKHIDVALQGNIEHMNLPFDDCEFDVILCLDVLEHLVDPWAVIHKLDKLLKPGGVIIASIPNVRYYKVSTGLLFKGIWDYKDEGILDRTHLRFFTYKTAKSLMECSNLVVDKTVCLGMQKGGPRYRTNLLSFKRLTHLLTEQYLMRAIKK
ncbi:MAG: class I SAM-dependent methyltransferase [Pseudomonadota bacterium]